MIAILLLLAIPILMWVVQSALLTKAGLPLRWRLDAGDAPAFVRTGGRITTQVCLISTIVIYPAIRGEPILAYYEGLLPLTRSSLLFSHGAAASSLFLCALFGAWLATDRLVIDIHHARRKWVKRLILLAPTALFGALVEELIFRGVLLADLLRSDWLPQGASIMLGALIFAGAHYVRAVKRRWTFPGHVLLGVLLCVAFLRTGSLWLPMGLHAGGIFMIMGIRPFVRYRGPAWLTGASIFPFAGVIGMAGLLLLTAFVSTYYGEAH